MRNVTYCLKFSLLLAFCFLLVCLIDQTQTCLSTILLLGLFQGDLGALNYRVN